jgi:hypothetical protein
MNTKQPSQEEDRPIADPAPYPRTPQWVKVFGIIALMLVALIIIALTTSLGGHHGPGRHLPSGGSGIEPVPAALTNPSGSHRPPAGPDHVTSRYIEAVASLPARLPLDTVRDQPRQPGPAGYTTPLEQGRLQS